MGELRIRCHDGVAQHSIVPICWHPAENGELDEQGYTRDFRWRTCSYCGSMHPEDFLGFIAKGATLESADWKYGWPHKFYIYGIANPLAGQKSKIGEKSDGTTREDIWGVASPTLSGKFYSEHLLDLASDSTVFAEIAANIQTQTGIRFVHNGNGLKYSVPPRPAPGADGAK